MKKLYGVLISMSFMVHASQEDNKPLRIERPIPREGRDISRGGKLPDDFKFQAASSSRRTSVIHQLNSYSQGNSKNVDSMSVYEEMDGGDKIITISSSPHQSVTIRIPQDYAVKTSEQSEVKPQEENNIFSYCNIL